MSVKEFGESATKLSRTPLGTIGLFLVFSYGMAGIVLVAGTALDSDQRWAFVIFLVVFPFVVFWGFHLLVRKYPKNLYAPSEYRNTDEMKFFMEPASEDQIATKARQEEEVVDIQPSVNTYFAPSAPQKSAYHQAESNAIAKIEELSRMTFELNQMVEVGGHRYLFDAIRIDKNYIFAIEVKIARIGTWRSTLDSFTKLIPSLQELRLASMKPVILYAAIIFTGNPTPLEFQKAALEASEYILSDNKVNGVFIIPTLYTFEMLGLNSFEN